MLTTSFKQVLISTALSVGIISCGGGSDDGGTTPPPPSTTPPANSAPTISSFAAEINPSSTQEVTYTWAVADTDDDALSCVLTLGGGIENISISDCLATTSTLVTYATAGSFTANLQVSDTSAATSNTDVNIIIEEDNSLPAPVVTAGDNELVIFYNRADSTYTGWGLHLWANDACTAYDGSAVDWAAPVVKTGDDPNYGAYWVVSLKSDFIPADCLNYIMHNGDNKAPNDADQQAGLSGERMIWLLDGVKENDRKLELRRDLEPLAYAQFVAQWVKQGANVVGGCCGTTAEHTQAITDFLAVKKS